MRGAGRRQHRSAACAAHELRLAPTCEKCIRAARTPGGASGCPGRTARSMPCCAQTGRRGGCREDAHGQRNADGRSARSPAALRPARPHVSRSRSPARARTSTSARRAASVGSRKHMAPTNYFEFGHASRVKRLHFAAALRAARAHEGGTAIDFGCADARVPALGCRAPTRPSGGRPRARVPRDGAARRRSPPARQRRAHLQRGRGPGLPPRLDGGADLALETLEHVGDRERMWESRADSVDGALDARTHPPAGRSSSRLGHHHHVVRPAGGAGCWASSASGSAAANCCAPRPAVGHRSWSNGGRRRTGISGSTHLRLERAMAERFTIVRKRRCFFQVLYVLRSRSRVSSPRDGRPREAPDADRVHPRLGDRLRRPDRRQRRAAQALSADLNATSPSRSGSSRPIACSPRWFSRRRARRTCTARRRIFAIGVAGFGASSLVCADRSRC